MPTEQNVARDDAITAIRFPIRLLTLVCILTIMAFAWFGWTIFDANRDVKMFADRVSRIEELRGVIVHLDEVLTMSARRAVATGDSQWEERYRRFEPQLDAAIKETIKTGASSSNIKAATQTDAANIKLVEMEERAFALVRAGRKEEAQAVLFGPEYEAQKKTYAEGIKSFTNQIRQEFDESFRNDKRVDLLSIIGALVVGGASFVAWFSAARGVRRWRAQLLDSVDRRAEAEQNLRKAHAELEVRVKERTAELANANEALRTENTERKRGEDALRASEERYRSLFESNPNPMWVYDVETLSFLAVNATAVAHYGYSQDEFLAMTLKDIRPPEDIPALMDDLSEKTDDVNNSTRWRHRKKDGALIDVEITSHELIWIGRHAKLVLINDISVRKDAEKDLAQMEGRYRGLLEAAPDAMVVVNQSGEIVLLNLQAEKQFGYRRDELVGQKVKNIIPEGFAERLVADDLRSAEDALAQQIGTGIELTGRRKNGSDFPIEIMLSPLESAEGILVTAAIRDITERKRAEERLREQADMLNRAHDAIIVRNFEDQRIVFWNSGAERLYGWSASEAIGRLTGELLYADSKEREVPLKLLSSTGDFRGELKQVTKDGGQVIVDARATIVRNPDGTPRCVLSINTDVTEQRKLETHLLRAQRLESIGTLASGVAHDLNNILTPILICAEVLKTKPAPDDIPALVSTIEESARRGANVVKQVLTFARGIEGERVVIKPSHLIQEMIDIAQKTFPKTIEILSRYPNDLWSIEGDPTQLHQVLLNLAVNARDAMLNGGTLTLGAENFNVDENYASMMPGAKSGAHVILRVTDTGRGMPRAMINKIFDPFFTTKEVGKGTGLGLSTALGIVKSHSGFISVYSEPGKGTTFNVFLPATTIQDDLQQSKTSVVPIQGNGELILVVDDEPNILGVTKMILEKHSYDVLSASDGPEALAIFAQQMQAISLVLTDLSMPYMGGVALVRALKKMRPDLSIVASTGQGEQAGVAELQSLGVKNFLTKPYNTDRLLAALDDTLHGRESESSGVQLT